MHILITFYWIMYESKYSSNMMLRLKSKIVSASAGLWHVCVARKEWRPSPSWCVCNRGFDMLETWASLPTPFFWAITLYLRRKNGLLTSMNFVQESRLTNQSSWHSQIPWPSQMHPKLAMSRSWSQSSLTKFLPSSKIMKYNFMVVNMLMVVVT